MEIWVILILFAHLKKNSGDMFVCNAISLAAGLAGLVRVKL